MTVANENCEIAYSGDGFTTIFDYPFPVQATSDVAVSLAGAPRTLGLDYTAALLSSGASGVRVTMNTPPAALSTLFMVRRNPVSQGFTFVAGMKVWEATIGIVLDKLTMLIGKLYKRSIQLSDLDPTLGPVYWPVKSARKNCVLAFDANGDVTIVPTTQLANGAGAYASLPIMKHEGIKALQANSTSGNNWYDVVAQFVPGAEGDPTNGYWNNNFWPVGGAVWTFIQTKLNDNLPGGFTPTQLGVLQAQALTYRSAP